MQLWKKTLMNEISMKDKSNGGNLKRSQVENITFLQIQKISKSQEKHNLMRKVKARENSIRLQMSSAKLILDRSSSKPCGISVKGYEISMSFQRSLETPNSKQ